MEPYRFRADGRISGSRELGAGQSLIGPSSVEARVSTPCKTKGSTHSQGVTIFAV